MHIGLIGGIGPAATEFYYRGLVKAYAEKDKKLELTIVQADMRELVKNAGAGAKQAQAEVYYDLVSRLKKAGADFAAVTSLGGHFCIEELETISPLPVLNAVRAINDYLDRTGIIKTALLGTRFVMESKIYGGISWADFVIPKGDDLEGVHAAYIGMAAAGAASDEQREYLFSVGKKMMKEPDVEAVLLAGTDLFLAFEGYEPGFAVIDCATVHINALFDYSLNPDGEWSQNWFAKPPGDK